MLIDINIHCTKFLVYGIFLIMYFEIFTDSVKQFKLYGSSRLSKTSLVFGFTKFILLKVKCCYYVLQTFKL